MFWQPIFGLRNQGCRHGSWSPLPLSPLQPEAPGSPIPRLIEKAFLEIGLGARLLTRTRVPIIKVCERPPEKLLKDLREERHKWENGITDDPADDEDHNDDQPPSPIEEHAPSHSRKEGSRATKETVQAAEKTFDEKLASLKQGDKRSLQGYYGIAKGLLRKLGGRDLTNSNASDFSTEDFHVLTVLSLAFVEGLQTKTCGRGFLITSLLTDPISYQVRNTVPSTAYGPRSRASRWS